MLMKSRTSSKIRLNVLQPGPAATLDAPLSLEFLPQPGGSSFDFAVLRGDPHRPLRTSSYVIYSNLPGSDEVLLVHGYTGAFDKVSRRLADYLRVREPKRKIKPLHGEWEAEADGGTPEVPSDGTIDTLKKRGYLTALTVEEEEAYFTRMADLRHLQAARRAPRYILMPTYECNLRCPYCFQDHMRTDPAYGHLLQTVRPEMVGRWLNAMDEIEAAHGLPPGEKKSRNVILFGGEPLLEATKPVIASLIERLRADAETQLSAITNGTDLHVYAELLGPDRISFLQITIDGPPTEHDRRRVYPDGSGSFDRIARNIDLALDLGVTVSVRMNIDPKNISQLPAVGAELMARGWYEKKGFSAYVAPIHAHDGSDKTDRTTLSSWELSQALRPLREYPEMRPIGGPDDMMRLRARQIFDKRSDPIPAFRSEFCTAHSTMYIFDLFGDIYACWERTGDPNVRIGAIDEAGRVRMNRGMIADWRTRSVTSNAVCRQCRYASYCGGGCAVLAEAGSGTLHSNYCDAFGKRFRTSVAEAYRDHVTGTAVDGAAERVCDL